MEIIYPFIVVIIIFLFVIILVSEIRNRKTEKILLNFQKQNLQEIEITLSQTTYNKFKQFGGIFKKAKLYFDKKQKTLILTTNKNAISSVMNNNLPLILINKNKSSLKVIENYKIVNDIFVKSDEIILIVKDNFSKTKRVEITIFSEKNDIELRNIITVFNDLQ